MQGAPTCFGRVSAPTPLLWCGEEKATEGKYWRDCGGSGVCEHRDVTLRREPEPAQPFQGEATESHGPLAGPGKGLEGRGAVSNRDTGRPSGVGGGSGD